MKQVYLAHPFTDGMSKDGITAAQNIETAKLWYRWACDHYWPDYHFNMMWVMDIEAYNAGNPPGYLAETPDARKMGMRRNFARIRSSQEVWLMGREVTRGMVDEALFALSCYIPVYNLTSEILDPRVTPMLPVASMMKWKPKGLVSTQTTMKL